MHYSQTFSHKFHRFIFGLTSCDNLLSWWDCHIVIPCFLCLIKWVTWDPSNNDDSQKKQMSLLASKRKSKKRGFGHNAHPCQCFSVKKNNNKNIIIKALMKDNWQTFWNLFHYSCPRANMAHTISLCIMSNKWNSSQT